MPRPIIPGDKRALPKRIVGPKLAAVGGALLAALLANPADCERPGRGG